MKPEWRRFAPFGLYLSLLAILGSIGLYIVQREITLALQISLGMIMIGLSVFAFLDPDRVRRFLTGRQARYGSNALVLILAFVGIIIVVNYLIYQNPKRWDMTEGKEFSLAPETLDTLDSLSETVKAQAFFTGRMDSSQAQDLLEQYKYYGDGMFDYEFIDPEANPVLAEQAKISRDGTIVLVMQGNQEPVTYASEQELTGAIVRLMNPEARTIYFLTGHGEYSPEDSGEQSYSQVKRTLESKNYTVESLNLLATNQIPEGAKVIVIPGPRKPLSASEIALISQYIEAGGALVVMEEPLPLTDYGDQPDPLAEYLSQNWNVVLGMDIVVDLTSTQPFAPYADQYGSHAITQKMQRITSQFPSVRSVRAGTSEGSASLVELVLTAPQSWAETDLSSLAEGNTQVAFNEGQDIPGPVPMAVVAENFQTDGRLVVFGDADFATDGNFIAYGNGDLFINSVDWAAGQESLIDLTPKDQTQRLMLPPQSISMNLILLGTVIVLPGLALLGGILVFVQRRRRG